ncbi:MAG: hypothetical protein ACI3ZY_02405 [Parabacteroides sp.]
MITKTLILFIGCSCVSLVASAQKREATERQSSRTIQIELTDTVRSQRTTTVTEEPVGKPTKKVKVLRPKDMKYRVTLLEVEFETEQYRARIAKATGEERRALLQELIDKVAHIKPIQSAEYDRDYTQVIVTLPDDSEYRVKL